MKDNLLVSILTIIFLCGCQSTEESMYTNEELSTESIVYGPSSPHYIIDAIYSQESHKIIANMKVSFENIIEEEMQEVYFNLWPNAEEFKEGSVDIAEVSLHGETLKFDIQNTVMKVSAFTLPKGQSVELDMKFTVTIPEMKNRFGWSEQQVSLGNWFPILAVHDNQGWNLHPYFPNGESFYSLSGDYDVNFEVPEEISVIATGEAEPTQNDENTHYQFTAKNVRDFAIVLHSDMLSKSQNVNETEVVVHYNSGEEHQAEIMLDNAVDAMTTFNVWFGAYPWKTLHVVSVDYSKNFDGGMEYPQLVTINTPYMEDAEELALTVVHEVAHQWFYSLVGNDSYQEPWLDESLATFSSYAAFYDTTDFDWIEEDNMDYSLTSSVAEFENDDVDRYGDIMYDGGALMLSALHDKLSEDIFFEGLSQYMEEMKYSIATTADFIRIMENTSGENLKPFFTSHGVYVDETN